MTANPANAYVLPTETGAAVMFDRPAVLPSGDIRLEVYAPFQLSPGEVDCLRAEFCDRVARAPSPRIDGAAGLALVALAELALLALLAYHFVESGQAILPVLLVATAFAFLPSGLRLIARILLRPPHPGRVVGVTSGMDGAAVQRIGRIWSQTATLEAPNTIDFEYAALNAGWVEAAAFYRAMRNSSGQPALRFRAD